MAVSLGPNLIEDGLVLSLDAGDINSVMGATVEVLVVAGGGGGGMDMGGGGGGGGVIYNSSYAVTQGTAVTVTVGNGGYGAPAGNTYRGDGAGPQSNAHQFTISATQGGNSVFGSLTAIGGGFGASSYYGYTPNSGVGGTGGSGGGCSGYTHGGERYVDGTNGSTANNVSGQGYPGGNSGDPTTATDNHYSGGGGGAGGRGTSGPNHVGPNGIRGNGGQGVLYSTMSPYYFAGGGGGSGYSGDGGNGGIGGGGGGSASNGNIGSAGAGGINVGSNGSAGANAPGGNAGANTGGGGSHYNSNNKGGDGGSGIVIVRYSGPQKATGGTISTVAGYTLHTFTSSGTFTPNSIWYDTSPNGNNGTFGASTAAPTYSSQNGGSFVFDGINDKLSTNFKPSGERSYFIWVKFSSLTHSSGYQLTGTQETNSYTYIGIQNGGDVYYYAGASTGGNIGNPVTVNTWVNLGFALFPDGSRRVYKNGIEIHYNTGGLGGTATLEFSVGCINQNHFITGNIAQVFVYNRALSASEVSQNYNSMKSRFGL